MIHYRGEPRNSKRRSLLLLLFASQLCAYISLEKIFVQGRNMKGIWARVMFALQKDGELQWQIEQALSSDAFRLRTNCREFVREIVSRWRSK